VVFFSGEDALKSRCLGLTLISVFVVLASYLQAQPQQKQAPNAAQAAARKPAEPAPKTGSKPTSASNPFEAFKRFSATLNGGIALEHDRQIYRSGDLMRINVEDFYRISDVEKRTTLEIKAGNCKRFPVPEVGTYPFSAYNTGFRVERQMTAEKQTVDGHSCKIENVTFTPIKASPTVIKMKLYEAEDLKGFPIQIEGELGSNKLNPMHYSNVSLDAPDPKLFEYPTECKEGAAPGQKGTQTFRPPQPKTSVGSAPAPQSQPSKQAPPQP
jgi:hypothetical protein